MKRDDIKAILGENASEEQITNLLNAFHNSEKAKNDELASLKANNDSLNAKLSDYSNVKSQLDEINRAKMTEQEKLEAREKATAEKEAMVNIMYNTARVKEILAGEEISQELLEKLVSADETSSVAAATALKAQMDSLREMVAKQTKESLSNVDLKPSITNVNQNDEVMNFEKFSKLTAEEQERFITEHPDEFERL